MTIRPTVDSAQQIVVELKVEDSFFGNPDTMIFEPKEGEPIGVATVHQFMHLAQVACRSGGATLVMATGDQKIPINRPMFIYMAATIAN